MDPLFKEVGIYAALGQRYEPVDSDLILSYREATDGQVLEEGITEAGLDGQLPGGGDVVRHARPGDHPVLHLLLDVRLPADRRPDVGVRRRARSRLPDGRHRRADDADRRGPPARRRPDPDPGLHHPEPARLRPGLRLRAGRRRPRRDRADVRQGRGRLLLRHDLQRELRPGRRARRRSTRASCAGSTGSPRRPGSVRDAHAARLVGSGSILQQVLAARDLLAEKFGVAAEVYSAPSFPLLRRDALEAERWNRLHPDAPPRGARTSARCSRTRAGRSWPPRTG